MKHSVSTLVAVLASWSALLVCAQEVCNPCADGLEPFLVGKVCENGIDLAATLTTDMTECQVLQLAMYQGDCCDTPPDDFCTLCEGGSQNYNLNKVVPRDAGAANFEQTCENYATRTIYLYEGATGICSDTERARARAWCECDGVQPACALTCDDGNPPPDMTKADPVRGETCERLAYEYSTLSAEECAVPVLSLNFDAKAFCCNEPEPNNCSICPNGMKLGSRETVVQTEFFGSETCGDIDTYASYLPAGSCTFFLNELLDDPTGAEGECCVANGNSGAQGGSQVFAAAVSGLVASTLWSLAML